MILWSEKNVSFWTEYIISVHTSSFFFLLYFDFSFTIWNYTVSLISMFISSHLNYLSQLRFVILILKFSILMFLMPVDFWFLILNCIISFNIFFIDFGQNILFMSIHVLFFSSVFWFQFHNLKLQHMYVSYACRFLVSHIELYY